MISDLLKGKSKEEVDNSINKSGIKKILNGFNHMSNDDGNIEYIINYLKENRRDEIIDYINNIKSLYNKLEANSKIGLYDLFKKDFETLYIDTEEFEEYYDGYLRNTIDFMGNVVRFNHKEIAKYLSTYDVVGNYLLQEHKWMNMAAELGHLDILKDLFEAYKNAKYLDIDLERTIYEATYYAYKHGKKDCLEFLLPHAKLSDTEEKRYKEIL